MNAFKKKNKIYNWNSLGFQRLKDLFQSIKKKLVMTFN